MPRSFFRLTALIAFAFCCSVASHAQCKDQRINMTFAKYPSILPHLSGSGVTGDCDPNRYPTLAATFTPADNSSNAGVYEPLIISSKKCSDPWIGQVYYLRTQQYPTPTQCNIANYKGGHWTSYDDLRQAVWAYIAAGGQVPQRPPSASQLLIMSNGGAALYDGHTFDPGYYQLQAGNSLLHPSPGQLYTLAGGDWAHSNSAGIIYVLPLGQTAPPPAAPLALNQVRINATLDMVDGAGHTLSRGFFQITRSGQIVQPASGAVYTLTGTDLAHSRVGSVVTIR